MASFEITKIIGAVLTAGLVASASNFISELVYEPEELETNVYMAATAAEEAPKEPSEEASTPEAGAPAAAANAPGAAAAGSIGPLLAAADLTAGSKVAKKCKACHSLDKDGPNKNGPKLWDVVNRPVASVPGFSYSGALQGKSGEAWSYANLDAFLAKPKDWAKGTKMSFGGIKTPEQRAALIAYLRSLSDSPAPLPE